MRGHCADIEGEIHAKDRHIATGLDSRGSGVQRRQTYNYYLKLINREGAGMWQGEIYVTNISNPVPHIIKCSLHHKPSAYDVGKVTYSTSRLLNKYWITLTIDPLNN